MILPKGGEVYVKCGADILINGLKTNLGAEARCPVCGNVTRFHIDNRRIENLAPKDPTLHVVEIQLGPGRLNIKVIQPTFLTRRTVSPSGDQPMLENWA